MRAVLFLSLLCLSACVSPLDPSSSHFPTCRMVPVSTARICPADGCKKLAPGEPVVADITETWVCL